MLEKSLNGVDFTLLLHTTIIHNVEKSLQKVTSEVSNIQRKKIGAKNDFFRFDFFALKSYNKK